MPARVVCPFCLIVTSTCESIACAGETERTCCAPVSTVTRALGPRARSSSSPRHATSDGFVNRVYALRACGSLTKTPALDERLRASPCEKSSPTARPFSVRSERFHVYVRQFGGLLAGLAFRTPFHPAPRRSDRWITTACALACPSGVSFLWGCPLAASAAPTHMPAPIASPATTRSRPPPTPGPCPERRAITPRPGSSARAERARD